MQLHTQRAHAGRANLDGPKMNRLLFPKLGADYFLLQTASRDHPAPKSQLINSAIGFWREVRRCCWRESCSVRRSKKSTREGVDAFISRGVRALRVLFL
jgi:hypothetical protein